MAYDIQGTFYEACDCEIICSCWAQIEPDMGQCTGIWVWHLDAGSVIDGQPADGCRVAIISNGQSCDDAANKLIIIQATDAQYPMVLNAVTSPGAWLEVFNPDVKTGNQGITRGKINIIPGNSDYDAYISVSNIIPVDPGVVVTHAVANIQFQMDDAGKKSTTQMSGSGRLINAVLGAGRNAAKSIDVGQAVAKPDPNAPKTYQALNLLADIPGYTFDLDIIRASAARGKFHYVNP